MCEDKLSVKICSFMLMLRTHFFVHVNKKLLWVRRGVFMNWASWACSKSHFCLTSPSSSPHWLRSRTRFTALLRCPRSSRAARTPPWWQWAAKLQRFSDVTKPVLCFFREAYILATFTFCLLVKQWEIFYVKESKKTIEIKNLITKAAALSSKKFRHTEDKKKIESKYLIFRI